MSTLPQVPDLEPVDARDVYEFNLAVVLDGVVYSVMNVTPQSAALFLSQPTFVQVFPGQAADGYIYDAETGTFSAPQ